MAKARAIVKRLKAVKNIRKITRTMELIATARFKKAMDRAMEAAAYTRKIAEIVADLSRSGSAVAHPLLESRSEVKKSLVLVLTSNRGLCGGYNSAVLRAAGRTLREFREKGTGVQLEVSGKRGLSFMKFEGTKVDHSFTKFEDKPGFDDIDVIASRYIHEFITGQIDRVDVVYTRFVSISRQQAVVETLLPLGGLDEASSAATTGAAAVEYEFLPSSESILAEIVPAAFKARLFKCFLDAAVSEQIARRVAMKGATENAGEMIGNLSRRYNRARQSQITSELSEIIGGAAALE